MSQTTTAVGRFQIADPDLGYDTHDGGTALEAQLRTNWTAISDHLLHRYVSTTLANLASVSITHNFGLALSQLKVRIWESGTLISAATQAAHYTITQTSTNIIAIQNTSGSSKTFIAVVTGALGGITSTDFDAACSLSTTGTVAAAGLSVTGDAGVVFNSASTEIGTNWKATLVRDTANMTVDATITLPKATSTLATTALAETLASKTLTSCAGITLNASAAIDWAAGAVAVGASIGANTLTLAGATSTVKAPGTLWAGSLQTDSNTLIMNQSATESGASWKLTLTRPASGMTADATVTLPAATGTLATLAGTEAFTSKDYQGGTASNTSRFTCPSAAIATLTALTRKQGTLVYATDSTELRLYQDDGTNLFPVAGPKVTGTVAAATAVVAASGITPAGAWFEMMFVKGSGGAVTISANPQIAAGTRVGQKLMLVGVDDTNTVTIANGTGLDLNGSCVLNSNQSITLFWDGSNWREVARRA